MENERGFSLCIVFGDCTADSVFVFRLVACRIAPRGDAVSVLLRVTIHERWENAAE